jgi:hypothetical protein
MKIKKRSRSKVVSLLDTEFSKYIRNRNSKCGISECYTCGKKDHWKNLQAGHFQSRKHYATRWHPINVQVQCAGCNIFRSGEQYKFAKNLDLIYGQGTANEMYQEASKTVKYSTADLLEMLDHYKALNKSLLK